MAAKGKPQEKIMLLIPIILKQKIDYSENSKCSLSVVIKSLIT